MNTPTPHQNIKEKRNKKPSIVKVIQSLKESGSEQTFKWYADCTGMFLKEATIEVAQKVFRYSETHTCDMEDVKDISLCKALWSKYLDDEDIVEIISVAMKKGRDERYNEIYSYLRNINIHYLYVDSFIDSLYIVFPELRKREEMSELQSEKMVRERLCRDILKNMQLYEDVKVDKGNNISQKEDVNSEMSFMHEEPIPTFPSILPKKEEKQINKDISIPSKKKFNINVFIFMLICSCAIGLAAIKTNGWNFLIDEHDGEFMEFCGFIASALTFMSLLACCLQVKYSVTMGTTKESIVWGDIPYERFSWSQTFFILLFSPIIYIISYILGYLLYLLCGLCVSFVGLLAAFAFTLISIPFS
ncbi:hypothetical protein [Bacteroides congonensis]|uniref:hypothetical protein n=1 Tax=Bacteroides congonensis TaxID=1871006 RepID=UPI003218FD77